MTDPVERPVPYRPTTVKDVAALAGVSAQTVSRVVNDHPNVAPATRQRVQRAIDRLNYTPSALARGLQSNRSDTIGVLLAGISYTGPAETLAGITSECAERNLTVLMAEMPILHDFDPGPILRSFVERRVDGIIMALPALHGSLAQVTNALADSRAPVVVVRVGELPGRSALLIDNQGATNDVVDHLVELGRTRIGHLAGPEGWREAEARSRAWRDRLAHHGLDSSDRYLAIGDWAAASGATAMQQLLNTAPDLDAVVAGNDRMALGAMRVLEQSGRRIPDDVAVTGFDNTPQAAWTSPSLTSVAQPLQEMGRRAVRAILDQRGDPDHPVTVEALACQVVVRESTGGLGATADPLHAEPAS